MTKLTGAQALIKSLEMEGVDVMFGLPGGASSLRTTHCSSRRSVTSSCATSRGPGTWQRATPT